MRVDRCQICGYRAKEEEFEQTYSDRYDGEYGILCPNCNSTDVEPDNYDPYLDDEPDDNDLFNLL
jgi:hypothetical protein